jgi:cell division protein FtsQ
MLKQRFILIGWCVLGSAITVLLIAAMKEKEHKLCSDINIEIIGAHQHVFVDENNVKEILKTKGALTGKDISEIDLRGTEEELEKDPWIKKAELFFDNNQVLRVKIDEREPLARVFTLGGNSFYIDSSGMRLPLSDQQSARVPVFTSFTSDNKNLSAPDSSLLVDVKKLAQFISQDSFWTAQVSQINITTQRTFEMVPVLGNQIIELGNADSLQPKFDRLYSFYKQVWAKTGFEKYEKIDVQYDGEVVATIRGAAKPAMDSLKAMQLLGNSTAKMNAVMRDTTYAAPMPLMAQDSAVKKINTKQTPKGKQKVTTKPKPSLNKLNSNKKTKPKAVMQKI